MEGQAILLLSIGIFAAAFILGIIVGSLTTRSEWRTEKGYDKYHESKKVWYRISHIGTAENLPFESPDTLYNLYKKVE